jgi:hypothetical protein
MATIVTVNGRALDAVISEQIAEEVREVRESENKFKVRTPTRTTGIRNHSGEKTAAGMSLYMGDPKATHILCVGNFWPIQAKRPFQPAGSSCFGAVEYCESTQEFKCHECAEWAIALGQHVQHRHKQYASFREYKTKFGLSLKTGVASPARKAVMRARSLRVPSLQANHFGVIDQALHKERLDKSRTSRRSHYLGRGGLESPERLNLLGQCRAQMINSLRGLYTSLGRTPTAREMSEYKNSDGCHSLHPNKAVRLFGSNRGFFACAGVPMRKGGEVLDPELRRRVSTERTTARWASMSAHDKEISLSYLNRGLKAYRDSLQSSSSTK